MNFCTGVVNWHIARNRVWFSVENETYINSQVVNDNFDINFPFYKKKISLMCKNFYCFGFINYKTSTNQKIFLTKTCFNIWLRGRGRSRDFSFCHTTVVCVTSNFWNLKFKSKLMAKYWRKLLTNALSSQIHRWWKF